MRFSVAANLAVKAAAVGLAFFPLPRLQEERFRGKGLADRALFYPLAPFVIPAIWLLQGRPRPYPHGTDTLWVAPFAIDSGANVLGLYELRGFDKLAHYVNWTLLAAAFGATVAPALPSRWNAATMTLGFGALSHVLWEIMEYCMMKRGADRMGLTYEDTIGDMAASLLGSLTGAALTGTETWRRRRPGRAIFGW